MPPNDSESLILVARHETDIVGGLIGSTSYGWLLVKIVWVAEHRRRCGLGAHLMARAITDHATPVGSGTVARTKRIPIEQRAEAAVIAWMRHQTTGYDGMVIPRVKGKRREVRRMLAERSHELLERYRRGESVGEECPLRRALAVEKQPAP